MAYLPPQARPQNGYQYGGVGFAEQLSWLYGTRWPQVIPGSTASTPLILALHWRGEGANAFFNTPVQEVGLCQQLGEDMGTKSTFPGSIASNVLTISADSVGPMWEGEVLGGAAMGSSTGIYIIGLHNGSPAGWGKATSTYDLAGATGVTATDSFFNDIFYKGAGPAFYAGPLNDIIVQNGSLAGSTGYSAHAANGPAGGPRSGRRWGAEIWQGLNNPNVPNDPTPDRVKSNASGCDTAALAAPCFDIGSTFAASHAATWSINGNVVTVTGGLAAHARPFVVGQAFSCANCNSGLVITSVSLPPAQDTTRANAGQVGNTFTFTVANASGQAIGVSGSGTVTAGCSGTSGTGSNCIDTAITINTTGTFGTAKAIATCGENNLNGNAPPFIVAAGVCHDNGIGTLVRTMRIGTAQPMSNIVAGSLFDDGVDFANGNFNQNAAYTCNVVAALIVQCVKAPTLASTGLLSAIGQWNSYNSIAGTGTFVNYGDLSAVSGRWSSMLGTVGGQSLPITNGGSGYSNQTVSASCTTIQSGGWAPNFDIKTSGGVITDVYPSATASSSGTHQAAGLGVGSTCTITPAGGAGAVIPTIALGPLEGTPGIGTYNTDTNTMGLFLYGNEGFPGNPLNSFYTNGQGGYFEPGDPVRPFGTFQGLAISG